jgi:hypothetical protein
MTEWLLAGDHTRDMQAIHVYGLGPVRVVVVSMAVVAMVVVPGAVVLALAPGVNAQQPSG